jgi:hypothetical protein
VTRPKVKVILWDVLDKTGFWILIEDEEVVVLAFHE